MPFPLAHPAAVLPFKRFCPRFLNFPALVFGSLSADAAYVGRGYDLETFSHSFLGSFLFCLPTALAMLWIWKDGILPLWDYRFAHRRKSVSVRLKKSVRVFRLLKAFLSTLISILIGAWTHLAWDSFTNNAGWAVRHIPFLQIAVMPAFGHTIRVCHLLWYASSVLGVAILCIHYWNAQEPDEPAMLNSGEERLVLGWRKALLYGALVLPIGMIHHLISGIPGAALVFIFTLCLIAATTRLKERNPMKFD